MLRLQDRIYYNHIIMNRHPISNMFLYNSQKRKGTLIYHNKTCNGKTKGKKVYMLLNQHDRMLKNK